MIYLDWEGGRSDPYWSDVLLLLPFDGSGQTFVDVGPLSADNTIAVIGGGGTETFEQNSTQTLFGNPTLEMTQVAFSGVDTNIFLENTTVQVPAGSDICMEYWYYQTSWAFAATPLHGWAQFRVPGEDLLASTSYPVPARSLYFRTTNNGPGESLITGSYDSGTWHYVAIQYVQDDLKAYVYVDGVQAGSYIASMNFALGMRFFVGDATGTGSPPNGGSTVSYSMRLAQMRLTAANRYGNVSSIEVPTEPWPTN